MSGMWGRLWDNEMSAKNSGFDAVSFKFIDSIGVAVEY